MGFFRALFGRKKEVPTSSIQGISANKTAMMPPIENRTLETAKVANGISRCCYVMCSTCNALHKKEATLHGWRSSLHNAGQTIALGTRTCKCGNVMQVADMYAGVHDLPRQYWDQVEGPVEVE